MVVDNLAIERSADGLSPLMHTSQSAVARLQPAGIDAKLSTLERYAAAFGRKLTGRSSEA
jgi:predicted transcriptional regulator